MKPMRLALRAAMGLLFLTYPAFANLTDHIRVDLPYDTQIGQVNLPAGEYFIRSVSIGQLPFLSVRSEQGIHVFVRTTRLQIPGSGRNRTAVVLTEDSTGYHVTQIYIAGHPYSYQVAIEEPSGAAANQ